MWYASDSETASWAKQRRRAELGKFPTVRFRMARLHVTGLEVLDLTDPATCNVVGVAEADLVADDYGTTQAVGKWAKVHGFEGILAPSAAMAGASTLVVFAEHLDKVWVVDEQVAPPPEA